MSYGIPPHLIPITGNGDIKKKNHLEWIKYRKTMEEYSRSGTIEWIEVPTNEDVLLGKGKPFRNHMGNLRLMNMVGDNLDRYNACTDQLEKRDITTEIVNLVKNAGRFLTQESGIWIEASDDIARQKVSHAFRNLRRNQPTLTTTRKGQQQLKRPDTPQADPSNSNMSLSKRSRC
jgi:hypothetical protein